MFTRTHEDAAQVSGIICSKRVIAHAMSPDSIVNGGQLMSNMDAFADVMALTSGAAFVRGDLHIHSVLGSHDVTDATATPEMIVQTALASGLSVIAIADHNSIDGVEAAINAAVLDDVLVVPAIELSTMQGHLLCYLPDMVKLGNYIRNVTGAKCAILQRLLLPKR